MSPTGRKVDVLAIGPHPDDVELACGGTLARFVASGRSVGILILTRGERGSRGSEVERRQEAERGAAALGCSYVELLDCGDGALRTTEAEEDALIDRLRTLRPELLLVPPAEDRHPDHERAHRLAIDSAFYSGLVKRGARQPHRPAAVFSYMLHNPFEPSFVVDVTEQWDKKLAALAVYGSQFHQPGAARNEIPTKVASPEFRAAIEGRARHYGQLIGAEFGEPFASRLPLAVSDPWQLLPGGLR